MNFIEIIRRDAARRGPLNRQRKLRSKDLDYEGAAFFFKYLWFIIIILALVLILQ